MSDILVRIKRAVLTGHYGGRVRSTQWRWIKPFTRVTRKNMGGKKTDDFYRLFVVPGMGHCQGGPGCSNVDWLTSMVNWVEKGIAPAMLIGAHREGGRTTRTRPICAYPNTAQYKGSGSIDVAENFICVPLSQ